MSTPVAANSPAASAVPAPPAGDSGGGTLLGKDDASAAGGATGAPAAAADKDAGAVVPDKAAADKAATDKAAADAVAQVELQIKLPDGFKEDASFGKFKEIAKAHGLKSEGAQAIVNLYAEAQQAQAEQLAADRETQKKEWEQELRKDADFGGAKFDENAQMARKALKAFGDAALKEFLADHPIGNYPPLVKMLAKIGRMNSEDALKGANSEGGKTAATNSEAFHRSMYPQTYAQHWDKK